MPRRGSRAMNIAFDGRTRIVTGAAPRLRPRHRASLRRARRRPSGPATSTKSGLAETRGNLRRALRAPRSTSRDRDAVQAVVAETGRARRGRHPGQQCRRRARPGRSSDRGDLAGRLAGDLRRQRDRRLLCAQAVAPGMKTRALRPHRQHLQRRRARHQPDRHPGLCQRQGRRRSALRASSPTSSGPGTSPSTMSRRASCAPIRPPSGSGSRWARKASSSSSNRSR